MMKKLLITFGMLVTSGAVFAANDAGSGCGLGATIFKGQSGIAPHVLAATTNGTSGNQTFGLSSGTSGCNADQEISIAAADFIDQNMEKVARAMATGSGESIDTLATLMGIPAADQTRFRMVSHERFSSIFNSSRVHSHEVIVGLNRAMKEDTVLAKYAK